ncbi:hypothetical protein BH11PLA1_BH11PLA1_12840 [soil metagenome]
MAAHLRRSSSTRSLLAGALLASLALGACEKSEPAPPPRRDVDPSNSTSVLGKSRDMGRELAGQIGDQQAGVGSMADGISGSTNLDAGAFSFPIPKGWQRGNPSNAVRAAELRVPNSAGESTVYFTTLVGGGGDTESNLARWTNQVVGPDKQPASAKRETFTAGNTEIVTLASEGTYLGMASSGAPPVANARVLRAIVGGESDARVFVTMYGPAEAVRAAESAWRGMLTGVKPK